MEDIAIIDPVNEIRVAIINPNNEIRVTITYSEKSTESGSLIHFTDQTNEIVNFTRSAIMALNRSASLNYILPFDLYPGQYRVFVYDIEEDGTLLDGVSYPAVRADISTRAESQGIAQCMI